MSTTKERLNYIDLLRFFCILLMVSDHIGVGQIYSYWVHAFHMPIWFFISGYFCDIKKDNKLFIKRKLQSLIIPYLFFSIVYILIQGLLKGVWVTPALINPIANQTINGALWFLPALFISEVISFLCLKYFDKWAYLLLAILSILGTFINSTLVFSFTQGLVGCGFYLLGYLFRKTNKLQNLNIVYSLIIIIIASVLTFKNNYVNMFWMLYDNRILFYLNASLFCVGFFNLFKNIGSKFNNELLNDMGRSSIVYVCTNQVVIGFLYLLYKPSDLYMIALYKVFELIFVMIVSYIGYKLVMKTKLAIVFGKMDLWQKTE